MDNNEDMKVPYEIRPEGTSATLNELALQHRQSVKYYETAARELAGADEGAADFFTSLAKYRTELVVDINKVLADMAGGVHTPSRSGESLLKSKEKEFSQALNATNVSQLAELAKENERGISDEYRHLLANHKLIDFAAELLQKQHETILTWVNRTDRFYSVPQHNNNKLE